MTILGALVFRLRHTSSLKTRQSSLQILTYHVVGSKVMSKDIADKTLKSKTVQGSEISIDATKDVVVDKAKVVKADIETSNGVIHIIDSVLMPPAK